MMASRNLTRVVLPSVVPTRSLHSRSPARSWQVWLVILVALSPNLVWIGLDRTLWPWDFAWYGKHTVDLFFTLVYSPSQWLGALVTTLGRSAPGIAWLGQFFVPVGMLLGSIDQGLLLSVFVMQAVALWLVARAIWTLSNGSVLVALGGVIVMASAPLFIALGHYYVVETMQAMTVAWFVLIMVRAPTWSRLLTAGQLGLATTCAMLAKVSSPIFCFGPGLVALVYLIRPVSTDFPDSRRPAVTTLACAIPLAVATAVWYYLNAEAVIGHVSMASTGPIAELYGGQLDFLLSLQDWLGAVRVNFFSTSTLVVGAGVFAAAIIVLVSKGTAAEKRFLLAAGVAAMQIAFILVIFSLSSNRDDRYLLGLLPYFVVILCWSIAQLPRRPLISAAVIAAFVFQWAGTHAHALGLIRSAPGASPWLNPVMTDSGVQKVVDSLVRRTCRENTSASYSNTIGVQLAWMNAPAVSYAAAKIFAPQNTLHCDYEAIAYYDTDEHEAWRRVLSRNTVYFVAMDPSTYTVPSQPVDRIANQLTGPILTRVENSGLFQLEHGIPEHSGILIFKRVDRIDYVVSGRALSDHGKHQQAVDELTKATTLDPANVEAWANLALAYERQGNLDQALAAGGEAARLSPNHYYVHLGLARVLRRQLKYKEAVERAEHAAANAPGPTERTNALALAGRSALQAGELEKGCRFLRQVIQSGPSNEINAELKRGGCEK